VVSQRLFTQSPPTVNNIGWFTYDTSSGSARRALCLSNGKCFASSNGDGFIASVRALLCAVWLALLVAAGVWCRLLRL
jgi:hypothetical protein